MTPAINPETGTRYSRAELLDAFNRVADEQNWKLPISKLIRAADVDVTREAVIFFTGSVPTFKPMKAGNVMVKAAGYYAAVGA